MFICQTVKSDRFLETLFCTRSFRSLLWFGSIRFFEYAANSAGGERLRRGEGETLHSRGETSDIILLNEIKGLSKMSLVAMCFVLQKSL